MQETRVKRPDPSIIARELDRLPSLCTADDYVDGVLWTKIRGATAALTSTPISSGPATDLNPEVSDGYMESVAQEFADDLDQLREKEGFEESGISRLVDALQMGADLFTSGQS